MWIKVSDERECLEKTFGYLLLVFFMMVTVLPVDADGVRVSGNAGMAFSEDSQTSGRSILYGQVTAYGQSDGVKAALGVAIDRPNYDAAYGSVSLFRRVNLAPGAYVQPMAQIVTRSSTNMTLLSVKTVAPVGSATASLRVANVTFQPSFTQLPGVDLPDGLNASWLEQTDDATPKGVAVLINSKIPYPLTVGLDMGWGTTDYEYLVQGGCGTALPETPLGMVAAQAVISSANDRDALIVRYSTPYFSDEYQFQGVLTTRWQRNHAVFHVQGTMVYGPLTLQAGVRHSSTNGFSNLPQYSLQANLRF